jgi:tRNA(Arg) A34 adenosine deaminase TadA
MKPVSTKDHNQLPEQILRALATPEQDVAFVIHDERVYFSRFPKSIRAPSSALVKLVQGIFAEFHDLSFFILRNRIYTNRSSSEMDQGMLKVAGKRATFDVEAKDHQQALSQFTFIEVGEGRIIINSASGVFPAHLKEKLQFLPRELSAQFEVLKLLAETNPSLPDLHDSNRKIAALLLDEQQKVIGIGLNQNAKNKTLHAEVNLVQSLYLETGLRIPKNSILLSTHKPCKMCAGMIFDSCEHPDSLRVYYQTEESGGLSRNTVLDQRKMNQRI